MIERVLLALVLLLLAATWATGDTPPKTGRIAGEFKTVWLRRHSMLVYLEHVAGKVPLRRKEQPLLDQKNKMFVPHLIPLLRGEKLKYVNHDDTKHNVYFTQPDGKKLNLGTGDAKWSKLHRMDQLGVYVHRCNIHDEMFAYIVVLQNPFFVKLDKGKREARFELTGIPPGKYRLRVWCERFYAKPKHKFNRAWDVEVQAGQTATVSLAP